MLDFIKQFDGSSPTLFVDFLSNVGQTLDKNDDDSIEYRERGNKLYQKKNFKVLIKNKSILLCILNLYDMY